MNILSWFALPKRTPPAPGTPGTGPVTGCDLGALSALTRPFAQDPFYRLRPPFSHEAASLSLELADAAYSLNLDAWTQAGWNDLSVLIDDSLYAGISQPVSEEGQLLRSAINPSRLSRARSALNERNPVSQILGALRQREKSDTIKAVCMMHPLEDGVWLLAIGFMGTGRRFYDWFSNFRFTTEEGFHRGFYQLCQSFEGNADEIVFPGTAQALGLEKLSLADVLMEMRSLSSRFRLWMSGHSQGSAVMQVFVHRLMNDWGVLAQNMVGYGFASPTVATGRLVYDPAAYPMYHILNSDDLITRLGALVHLGMCVEYESDQQLRLAVYDVAQDAAAREAVRLIHPYFAAISDTPEGVLRMTALLECIIEEKGEAGMNELMETPWMLPFLDRLLVQAGGRVMDLAQKLLDGLKESYAGITGQSMDAQALSELRQEIRPVVQTLSVRQLITAVVDDTAPPHRLMHRSNPPRDGAYAWIVKNGLTSVRAFVWVKASHGACIRRYAQWSDAALWPSRTPAVLRARRSLHAASPHKGKLRATFSARRSRSAERSRS